MCLYIKTKNSIWKYPHTKFLMVVVSYGGDYEVSLPTVSNSLHHFKFLYRANITFIIRKNIKILILWKSP